MNDIDPIDINNIDLLSERRKKLISENLGLIGWSIQRFFPHVPDVDREDAWQDGFFGLVRAARGYDFDMGLKFSTYATGWIRSAVQKGRGNAYGINFRRAISKGDSFSTPISLDKTSGQDGDAYTLGDTLSSDDDVDDEATNTAAADYLKEAFRTASRDAIDLAIAEEIIGSSYEDRSFDFKRLTEKFNFSRYGIHLRRQRLIDRAKTIFESGESNDAASVSR